MTAPGEVQHFFRSVVLTHEGNACLLWPFAKQADGYGVIWHRKRTCVVSRLLCEKTKGPAPSEKHEAAHNCGNSSCVNASHIEWKTHRENEADKKTHGTVYRGSKGQIGEINGSSKLTVENVKEIRRLKGRLSHREIAKKFGLNISHVSKVQRGIAWAHV